jgi:O-antigen/teichoic acid export membrane protein
LKRTTGFFVVTTFLTKILFLGGSFITSILLARFLGPEGQGMVTALFVIPNIMVSIGDLGIRQAATYYLGRKEYDVQEIFSSSLFMWIMTSIFSAIIVFIFYSIPSTSSYPNILILIGLSFTVFKILESYLNGVLQGMIFINQLNIKFMIEFLTRMIIVLVFVGVIDFGVYGGAASKLVSIIFVIIYSLYVIRKKLKISFRIEKNNELIWKLISKGIIFALALFILQLNYKVDIIILEALVSSEEVGIYSVGVQLAELIWQLPLAISMVLFSKSANSKSDKEASDRAVKLLRLSLLILTIGGIIFAIFSEVFINLFYGVEYSDASMIINLLIPGVLIATISKILHPSLSARGYPLYGLYVFILPLLINIILNLIFIPEFGINAAAISSTVSYTIGGITYAIVYSKKVNIKIRKLLFVTKEDINMIISLVK